MSDVSVGVPAAGLDDEGRQAEAQEQLKDAEVEFGHDAPPRRATPDNPEAAEDPSEVSESRWVSRPRAEGTGDA
jgi:hypothetical protein